MRPWMRLVSVSAMVVTVGVITWLLIERGTPSQPASLAVLVDGGTEALRTVDRMGKIATQMSSQEEVSLGNQIAAKIEGSYSGWSPGGTTRRQRYVQEVVSILALRGGLRRPEIPYVASVVSSSSVNAYAIPGGHVYITTGMLDRLRTEAELAAVMGHEMAHVDLKHCVERIQYEHAAKKIGGQPLAAMTSIGYHLFSVGFSDELEAEADRKGTIYAERAGYHPQAGQVVFARLKAMHSGATRPRNSMGREVRGMIADALGDYFGSHPDAQERIELYERVFRDQRFDLDHTRYYLGRQNYIDMRARSQDNLRAELKAGRIYP